MRIAARIYRIHLATTLLATLLAVGCASVPFDYPRDASEAIAPSQATTLGQEAADWSTANGGSSGFLPLTSGMDALGARLHLINAAEVSIDAQYFLIKPDPAGGLFVNGLVRAADRGVRIRFLIDDIFTPNVDSQLALLSTHPNIEVRMFNPLTRNSFRYWSLLVDHKRANRRMHNKSFTVDNSFTIVGGRNIAAEYFAINEDVEFIDFEIVGIGPVARNVSDTFDEFWNSDLSVPMEAYGYDVDQVDLNEWSDGIAQIDTEESIYNQALTSTFLMNVLNEFITPIPADATVVTDSPMKLETPTGVEEYQELANVLTRYGREAQDEIIIITPYFVPRKTGAEFLSSLAQAGVRVRVLTNSLASTNHVPVHSGYARYRKRLLEAGVELYELKHDSIVVLDDGTEEEIKATLHTKAMIFDRETLFIGSLNLDPRSIDINTEMGLFLHSPRMAQAFAELIDQDLPFNTYRAVLEDGKLRWRYEHGDEVQVLNKEPQTGWWRRFSSGFYGILPIEGQL